LTQYKTPDIIGNTEAEKMNTYYPQRRKISVTLELEVYDDFDPVSIDWFELLELSGGETVEVSITETQSYEGD